MNPDEISRLAFLLYPDVVRSKPDAVATESLAARIKAIQKGLLPEDEFAATVCWLGNCAGIHRIDQSPMPLLVPPERMRAPDFIAFPVVDGKPVPVLVEVKAHAGKHLDWTQGYLLSLLGFAEHLHLPLLVAWKCGDLWTLVDCRHFERNVSAYRLTLKRALEEDLFCVLFRNLRIQMNPELELILDMNILERVKGGTERLLPAGRYPMQVAASGLYCRGVKMTGYQRRHFTLLLTAPDDVEIRRTGIQACRLAFRPLSNRGFTLSNVLVAQLSLRTNGPLDWHRILNSGAFPSSGRDFRDSLPAAIDEGFVRYVLDIVPKTWPAFLPQRKP